MFILDGDLCSEERFAVANLLSSDLESPFKRLSSRRLHARQLVVVGGGEMLIHQVDAISRHDRLAFRDSVRSP